MAVKLAVSMGAEVTVLSTSASKEADAGDASTFCGTNANSAFSCRSSGGGSQNRKVCVP